MSRMFPVVVDPRLKVERQECVNAHSLHIRLCFISKRRWPGNDVVYTMTSSDHWLPPGGRAKIEGPVTKLLVETCPTVEQLVVLVRNDDPRGTEFLRGLKRQVKTCPEAEELIGLISTKAPLAATLLHELYSQAWVLPGLDLKTYVAKAIA